MALAIAHDVYDWYRDLMDNKSGKYQKETTTARRRIRSNRIVHFTSFTFIKYVDISK